MKKCWFCGRKLMQEVPEFGRGWFKCECGATWSELPKVKTQSTRHHRKVR